MAEISHLWAEWYLIYTPLTHFEGELPDEFKKYGMNNITKTDETYNNWIVEFLKVVFQFFLLKKWK